MLAVSLAPDGATVAPMFCVEEGADGSDGGGRVAARVWNCGERLCVCGFWGVGWFAEDGMLGFGYSGRLGSRGWRGGGMGIF